MYFQSILSNPSVWIYSENKKLMIPGRQGWTVPGKKVKSVVEQHRIELPLVVDMMYLTNLE